MTPWERSLPNTSAKQKEELDPCEPPSELRTHGLRGQRAAHLAYYHPWPPCLQRPRPPMGSRQWLELTLDGLWGSARRDSCPPPDRAPALQFKGAASTQPCWEPLTSFSVNCANASCRRGRQETFPSLGKLPWPGAQPTSCQEAKGLRGLWFGQELLFERWSC